MSLQHLHIAGCSCGETVVNVDLDLQGFAVLAVVVAAINGHADPEGCDPLVAVNDRSYCYVPADYGRLADGTRGVVHRHKPSHPECAAWWEANGYEPEQPDVQLWIEPPFTVRDWPRGPVCGVHGCTKTTAHVWHFNAETHKVFRDPEEYAP